jgi:hypothetical protein
MTWGVEHDVLERFGKAGVPEDRISLDPRTYTFEFPAPPAEFLAAFRDYYGPTMNAYAAAEAAGRQDDLHQELGDLIVSQNTSADPGLTSIPATYLQVTVSV